MQSAIRTPEILASDGLGASDRVSEWRPEIGYRDRARRTAVPAHVVPPVPALILLDEGVVLGLQALKSSRERYETRTDDLRDHTAPPCPAVVSLAAPESRMLKVEVDDVIDFTFGGGAGSDQCQQK